MACKHAGGAYRSWSKATKDGVVVSILPKILQSKRGVSCCKFIAVQVTTHAVRF